MTDAAPRHLLAVDDDSSVLGLLHDIFTDAGYCVTTRPAGPSTAEVEQLAPDLVVINHRLQGETGLTISQRLAADPLTAHIPAVLCTADYRFVDQVNSDAAAAGICVVRKPFDLDELLMVVTGALRCHREGTVGGDHSAQLRPA